MHAYLFAGRQVLQGLVEYLCVVGNGAGAGLRLADPVCLAEAGPVDRHMVVGTGKQDQLQGWVFIVLGEVEKILLKYSGIIETAVVGVKSSDDISDEMIDSVLI